MDFLLAFILLLLSVGGVVVRKTYYYLPARELKRRAQKQDALAVRLYSAVAYGSSLRGLLWLYIALTSAGGFILLARTAPTWLALLAVVGLLWVAFSWIPSSRMTWFGSRLTVAVTPVVTWILNYLHPLFDRSVGVVERRYTAGKHTGLFERNDLLELIEQQQVQSDNRLSEEELNIVRHALQFSEVKVASVLTPLSQIKVVLADETVGPILIDEVHQSGQPFVLVRETVKGSLVGSLATDQLGIKSKGKIQDLMDPTVYYLHENDSLREALHAFFVTNHPLFVVVNNTETTVGIVTVETMLRQLVGHLPGEDFDQYAEPAAVAARHRSHKKAEEPEELTVKTDEEVIE